MFSVQLESTGVGTVLDATGLEFHCTSYALYRDAAEQVAKYGPCWVANGDKALFAEFGITPSSRSGLAVDKPQ